MLNAIDKTQKILIALFCFDIIALILSFIIDRSFRIANYFGYTGMFILTFIFVYTGYKHLSFAQKEGQVMTWYKEPWIIVGFITGILAILLIITNK